MAPACARRRARWLASPGSTRRPGRRLSSARLATLRAALWRSPFHCTALRERGLSPDDLRRVEDLPHFPLLDTRRLAGRVHDASGAARARPGVAPLRGAQLRQHRAAGRRPEGGLRQRPHVGGAALLDLPAGLRLPARPRIALLCTLPHGVEYRTPLPVLRGTLERISLVRPDARRAPRRLSARRRLHRSRGAPLARRPAGSLRARDCCCRPRCTCRPSCASGSKRGSRRPSSTTTPARRPDRSRGSASRLPAASTCCCPTSSSSRWRGSSSSRGCARASCRCCATAPGTRAEVERHSCGCGHRGYSILGLAGRSACSFTTPDGRAVDAWRLAWVFQHHPLDGFRLTQESGRSLPARDHGRSARKRPRGSSSDSARRSGRSAGPRRASSMRASRARLSRPRSRKPSSSRARWLPRTTDDPSAGPRGPLSHAGPDPHGRLAPARRRRPHAARRRRAAPMGRPARRDPLGGLRPRQPTGAWSGSRSGPAPSRARSSRARPSRPRLAPGRAAAASGRGPEPASASRACSTSCAGRGRCASRSRAR